MCTVQEHVGGVLKLQRVHSWLLHIVKICTNLSTAKTEGLDEGINQIFFSSFIFSFDFPSRCRLHNSRKLQALGKRLRDDASYSVCSAHTMYDLLARIQNYVVQGTSYIAIIGDIASESIAYVLSTAGRRPSIMPSVKFTSTSEA